MMNDDNGKNRPAENPAGWVVIPETEDETVILEISDSEDPGTWVVIPSPPKKTDVAEIPERPVPRQPRRSRGSGQPRKNIRDIIVGVAVAAVLIGASAWVLIPREVRNNSASAEPGLGNAAPVRTSGEVSDEAFSVEPLNAWQYTQCVVHTWGGAVIDESGYLWLWARNTMVAENTGIGNLKAIAQTAYWPSSIYFLSNKGKVGYIEVNDKFPGGEYSDVGAPVWLSSPSEVVYIYADGSGCYTVDKLGRVGYYDGFTDTYTIIEKRIRFEDIQCVNGGLFGKAADGNYYAFGNDVFGAYTQNTGASTEISRPEQLFEGTNLEAVHVFSDIDSGSAMFAKLYTGQNLLVYDYTGEEICALSECMALFSGREVLYAVDFFGNLYAYGEYSSGAPLDMNTSVYTGNPTGFLLAEGLGTGLRSIGIGGWGVALVYEDGSVRTWGQGYEDCYITDVTGNRYFLNS